VGIIDHPISTVENSPARAKSEEASQIAQHKISGHGDEEFAPFAEAVFEGPPRKPRRTHGASPQAREIPAAPTTTWKNQGRRGLQA